MEVAYSQYNFEVHIILTNRFKYFILKPNSWSDFTIILLVRSNIAVQ
jgi:hypothetical protein